MSEIKKRVDKTPKIQKPVRTIRNKHPIPDDLLEELTGKFYAKGYSHAGASKDKVALKGFDGISGSASEDIHDNLQTLRNNSRMLEMESPFANSVLNTMTTNVIGRGLRLQSKVNRDVLGLTPEQAEELEDQIEREFALWADDRMNCDSDGMDDFYGLQQLAYRASLQSGDSFILIKRRRSTQMRPYSIRLQLIEADRCRTPNSLPGWSTTAQKGSHMIYDGVEVDSSGEVVSYHFSKHHPNEFSLGMTATDEFYTVQAFGSRTGLPNVLQIMRRIRPEQYRGIPLLAEVIEQVLQINRYSNAETMSAVLQAYASIWITRSPENIDDPTLMQLGEDADYQTDDELSWSPASINYLDPGENVTYTQPTHPSANYASFLEANLTQIGAGVGIPYDILTKKHNASYSASRAAQLDFSKEIEMRREWFVRDFCDPVFEWFMTEAVARGRIIAPGFTDDPIKKKAYLNAEWIGPSLGSINPKDEITSLSMAVQNGWMTNEQAAMILFGYDWYNNVDSLKRERELQSMLPPDPTKIRTISYSGEGGERNEVLDNQSVRQSDTADRD